MLDFQQNFIEQALKVSALKFGEFTLKSGRQSPYFFNMGECASGKIIQTIGYAYAHAILQHSIEFDCLFGAAYKGIPLVVATAIALAELTGRDVPYSYNRKEAKKHGEGGVIVGPKPQGKVIIIDDVMTAGTAMREVASLLTNFEVEIVAIALGLDRQEKGQGSLSAVQEIAQDLKTQVISVVTLENLITYLELSQEPTQLAAMKAYQAQYAVC